MSRNHRTTARVPSIQFPEYPYLSPIVVSFTEGVTDAPQFESNQHNVASDTDSDDDSFNNTVSSFDNQSIAMNAAASRNCPQVTSGSMQQAATAAVPIVYGNAVISDPRVFATIGECHSHLCYTSLIAGSISVSSTSGGTVDNAGKNNTQQ
ncbi:hypothetical protein FBU30_004602 [Linnemannia zychae]|nr:hypothetical protein FBU30_004602 [Linnemannia zychae]